MKKISKILMPFMLTALCVACNKEEYGKQADGNPVQITVIAEVEQLANTLDTKTYIDGYDILWSENEQMTIYLLNGTNAIDCKSDYFEGAGLPSAKFGFNFSSGEIPENGPYVLGGIYPSSADKGVTDNTTNDKVDLPSIQSPTATSYDPAAYILVARPETFDEIPAEWTASYRRAAALNKISLTGIGEDIISVDITVPDGKDLAGRRYIDLSTGKSGEIYYGGTNTVSVKYTNPLPHNAANVWFTSWGVELSSGEEMTIKATTATKIYTKTIAARAEGISFIENYLNTLAVDMSDAVIDEIQTSTIDDGEYLIAGYKNYWGIMTPVFGTTSSKDFLVSLELENITKPVGEITCADFYPAPSIADNVWTLTAVENGYTIQNAEGKYLCIEGVSIKPFSDTPFVLTILPNEDGTYSISDPNSVSNTLRYNQSNTRFRAYSNDTMPYVILIPWIENAQPSIFVTEASKTVGYNAENVTFEYTTNNIDGNIDATKTSDTDNIISNISVSDGIVNITLVPNSEEKEKSATITLSYPGAESAVLTIKQNPAPGASARYYVKVTENQADWSGEYLIVFEAEGLVYKGSLTTDLDAQGNHYSVQIIDGQILHDTEAEANSVTIENHDGSYAIKTASEFYIYQNEDKNGLKYNKTYTQDCTVAFSISSDGTVEIKGSGSRVLAYNNQNSGYVRFYSATSSYPRPALYKLND